MSKNRDYNVMIQSERWRVLRRKKIKENPLCEECAKNGIIMPAEDVHHVIPVESAEGRAEMMYLMFDYRNLMSLCKACHADAHRRLMSHSREEARRRADKRNERFAERFLE